MKRRLKCEISRGMFSDEVTVKVRDVSGASIAVFVPRDKVNEKEKVVFVSAYEGNGKTFAVLPDDRHTSITVQQADLQPA